MTNLLHITYKNKHQSLKTHTITTMYPFRIVSFQIYGMGLNYTI